MAPGDRMVLVRGDITTLAVDAVANSANSSLLCGGEAYGAYERALSRLAGPP